MKIIIGFIFLIIALAIFLIICYGLGWIVTKIPFFKEKDYDHDYVDYLLSGLITILLTVMILVFSYYGGNAILEALKTLK